MLSNRIILLISIFGLIYSTTECTFNADPTPPSAPVNIVTSSGDSMIEMSWNLNNEGDFEGYNLYKSEQNITDISVLTPVHGDELYFESSYTDEQVENGITYYYRITAVDLNGNESEPSQEIRATPFSEPPIRP